MATVLTTALLIPLRPLLARFIEALIDRHPSLFTRMGGHSGARILIDPIDLPLSLVLIPHPRQPVLEPLPGGAVPACDASISGRLRDLVALVSGDSDGDALFFAREIEFTGSTEVVLALRNAIDATNMDLIDEIETFLGPLGAPLGAARSGARYLQQIVERATARLLAPAMSRIRQLEHQLDEMHRIEAGKSMRRMNNARQREVRALQQRQVNAPKEHEADDEPIA
jgi:O2-independent ubiquinone biosynthesis accessory factor UbiT